MFRPLLTCFLSLFLVAVLPLRSQAKVEWKGPVTQLPLGSLPALALEVGGRHVLLGPQTHIQRKDGKETHNLSLAEFKPYLGAMVEVFGASVGKGDANHLEAERLVLLAPGIHKVSGQGIVDAILPTPSAAASGSIMVRADGYPIQVPPSVKATYYEPLPQAAPITTNLWITFEGMQQPDGIVVASDVTWSTNHITDGENKLRNQAEYDPAEVDAQAKQSKVSRAIRGVDPRQLPPYADATMQARVVAIGEKLVPRYQRDLPDNDPTKLDFRFQVVDESTWQDAHTLPNGIILIAHQTVERTENDSQLAAVLADNIACALEKQTLLAQPAGHKMTAAQLAGTAGGFFVPGLGIATSLANGGVADRLTRLRREQSSRVSLGLLHDAGYEIDQAPLAWWLLASKKPKPRIDIYPPDRVLYLYEFLGATYSPQAEWINAAQTR